MRQKQIPHWLNNPKTAIFDFLNETQIQGQDSGFCTELQFSSTCMRSRTSPSKQVRLSVEAKAENLNCFEGLGSTVNLQGAQSPSDTPLLTVTKINGGNHAAERKRNLLLFARGKSNTNSKCDLS